PASLFKTFQSSLTQSAQQSAGMTWRNGKEVSFGKRQKQPGLVQVEQVVIGRNQDRDLGAGSLAKNSTVISLLNGQETAMDQPSAKTAGHLILRNRYLKKIETPFLKLIESKPSQ